VACDLRLWVARAEEVENFALHRLQRNRSPVSGKNGWLPDAAGRASGNPGAAGTAFGAGGGGSRNGRGPSEASSPTLRTIFSVGCFVATCKVVAVLEAMNSLVVPSPRSVGFPPRLRGRSTISATIE